MDKRQKLLYEISLFWRELERSYRYMNMDYDLFMQEILKTARAEIEAAGYEQLQTPEAVEEAFARPVQH